MKDVVISNYLNAKDELEVVEGEQHLFGYRTSFIQKKWNCTKSHIKLRKVEKPY